MPDLDREEAKQQIQKELELSQQDKQDKKSRFWARRSGAEVWEINK